jgi:K+/H+ antiporter YhaU regulatory subunit KhtT
MIKKTKHLFSEDADDTKLVMPSPDYKIEENDILVLFGTDEKIAVTSDW